MLRHRAVFRTLVAAFGAYAALYIARTSFVVDGVRFFTLADDQMISMRYAENLANGFGLVWNPGGERIEGYTNFLWVVYMALFHALHIPRPVISVCIEISGAAFLALNLLFVRKIALAVVGDQTVALLAAAMTAFYVPLDNWAFQGTEVSLLTAMVSLGVLWTLESWRQEGTPWRLWILAAATTLVRPDMVTFAAAGAVGAAAGRPDRARSRMLSAVAVVGAFLLAETAFRVWYFGDPLPNTYYLKVTGVPAAMKVARGFFVAVLFLAQLAPLIVAMFVSGRLKALRGAAALLLGVFVTQVLYSVSVGGDAWEWWGGSNRFVAIAMPLFFVCAADAIHALWTRLALILTSERGVRWDARMRIAAPAAIAAMIVGVNWLAYSLTTDRMLPLKRLLLVVKPYETASDERAVRAGLALREFTRPDAVVGVVWAGAIPYFSERTCVDLLGKMDRRIAHEPMRDVNRAVPWWAAFHPGHMKWDYDYSIGELKPDVVQAPLWPVADGTLASKPFLSDYALETSSGQWYVRKGSPRLLQLAQR